MGAELDVRTWLTVLAVMGVFFAVPISLLFYDRWQHDRLHRNARSEPTEGGVADERGHAGDASSRPPRRVRSG